MISHQASLKSVQPPTTDRSHHEYQEFNQNNVQAGREFVKAERAAASRVEGAGE